MEQKLDTAQTLAQWEAQEAERRKSMTTNGVARPEQVAGLTGMQVFERMFSGELPYPPVGETMDFLPVEVHSTLPAGKGYTTAELKVNFVRALTTRVPLLRAIGSVIHVGARMATADGRLVGPDGKLYAHASTTCFIFDTP